MASMMLGLMQVAWQTRSRARGFGPLALAVRFYKDYDETATATVRDSMALALEAKSLQWHPVVPGRVAREIADAALAHAGGASPKQCLSGFAVCLAASPLLETI